MRTTFFSTWLMILSLLFSSYADADNLVAASDAATKLLAQDSPGESARKILANETYGNKSISDLIASEQPMVNLANEKPVVINLRESILIALRYNPTVESGEIQRIIDKFTLRVAFWSYELHYTLTGTANYNFTVANGTKSESDTQAIVAPAVSLLTPIGTTVTATMTNPLAHVVPGARYYNPGLVVGITQPLLQGFGSDIALSPLRQAEYTEILNRLTLQNTVMTTITSVITQYVALAQAENGLIVQRLSLDNSIATLRQQEAMLKAGRVAEADLVQFQATVASQQLSIEQQEVSLLQTRQALLSTLGIDPSTPITTTKQVRIENDLLPTLKECIRQALLNNIAYQQGLIGLRVSKINLALAADQQRWTLNLTAARTQGAGAGGKPNSGIRSLFNGEDYGTSVGLALTVPIDDLALQKTLVQAKVSLRQQYIALAALKRQTVNNVINAYNTVLSQKEQITQAKIAVELAQQSLDVALAKLKYGRVTPFEVSTLQTTLVTTQLSYINTVSIYVTNLAALDQIIGYTLDRWQVKIKY